MVDAGERLQVLLTQEATIYQTSDYLTRMQKELDIGSFDQAAANVAAALAEKQKQQQQHQIQSTPSSPKKRKSWDDLTSVEDESLQTCSTSHKEQCRRTAATTCASSSAASANAAAAGGSIPGDGSSAGSNPQINKHWREKICEWAYQVVDHFDLNREVVSTTMSHLDRYLAAYNGTEPVDKNLFQLLAMTCLYLSIKLNEYKHLLIPGAKSTMDTILQLSRGFFKLEEMEKMEYEVLQRLRWHVHPPTAQLFVKHFLLFLSVEENELQDLAQFMIELSVMDYFFVSYKPSEIAMAALLNSMDRLGSQAKLTNDFPFNSNFVDMHSPAVLACRERLSLIYAQANEQGGVEDPEATPAKTTEEPEPTPVEVPEPARLQRTISPVSVMAPPEPNENTTKVNYGYSKSNSNSTTTRTSHQQQQLDDDDMDTDEGYFFDETEGEFETEGEYCM